jgi:hypothetical protein
MLKGKATVASGIAFSIKRNAFVLKKKSNLLRNSSRNILNEHRKQNKLKIYYKLKSKIELSVSCNGKFMALRIFVRLNV